MSLEHGNPGRDRCGSGHDCRQMRRKFLRRCPLVEARIRTAPLATLPSQNGCFASHSTTSCPSRGSFQTARNRRRNFRGRERRPARTRNRVTRSTCRVYDMYPNVRREGKDYGVFGGEPSGFFGIYRVAFSSTPSRIGILTPQRRS